MADALEKLLAGLANVSGCPLYLNYSNSFPGSPVPFPAEKKSKAQPMKLTAAHENTVSGGGLQATWHGSERDKLLRHVGGYGGWQANPNEDLIEDEKTVVDLEYFIMQLQCGASQRKMTRRVDPY